MPQASRTPFDGTTKLIIDGTNLLYKMGSGPGAAAPPAAIVGRVRGIVPADIAIDLVFDGQGHGVYGRVAQKMLVRYSGRRTADDVILDLASEGAMEAGGGPAAGSRILVVTDDRELRIRLTAKGARTAALGWLLGRLDIPILQSPSPGNRRPPIGSGRPPVGSGRTGSPGSGDETERPCGVAQRDGERSKTGERSKRQGPASMRA